MSNLDVSKEKYVKGCQRGLKRTGKGASEENDVKKGSTRIQVYEVDKRSR